MTEWEQAWVEQGLCQSGELLAHLRTKKPLGASDDLDTWPHEVRSTILEEAKRFAANAKAHGISGALGVLKLKWDANLVEQLGLPAGTKPEDLNREQFATVMQKLNVELQRQAELRQRAEQK